MGRLGGWPQPRAGQRRVSLEDALLADLCVLLCICRRWRYWRTTRAPEEQWLPRRLAPRRLAMDSTGMTEAMTDTIITVTVLQTSRGTQAVPLYTVWRSQKSVPPDCPLDEVTTSSLMRISADYLTFQIAVSALAFSVSNLSAVVSSACVVS